MNATAAQAEQAALSARAAAAAYEAAFSTTVPPPVVSANRMLLASLVATNILGQNMSAIAATEAHYAEMWAQDAAAMYGYAGSSAAVTQLTPFTEPPEMTNGNTAASQSTTNATHLLSQVPNTLQSLTTNPTPWSTAIAETATKLQTDLTNATTFLKTMDGPYTPLGVFRLFKNWWQVSSSLGSLNNGMQSMATFLNPKPITGALAPLLASELLTGAQAVHPAGVSAGAVTGALGRAGMVGSLSVPANWASAAPGVQSIASVLPTAVLDAAPAIAVNAQNGMFGEMALSSLAGRAFGAPVGRAVGATATRTIGAITHVTNTAVAPNIATTATVIVIPPIEK